MFLLLQKLSHGILLVHNEAGKKPAAAVMLLEYAATELQGELLNQLWRV